MHGHPFRLIRDISRLNRRIDNDFLDIVNLRCSNIPAVSKIHYAQTVYIRQIIDKVKEHHTFFLPEYEKKHLTLNSVPFQDFIYYPYT
jgi:hypothetical protein